MGKSLPPKIMVGAGKFMWTTLWRVMMSQLAPRNASGAYIRPESQFRHRIDSAFENPYKSSADRYTLIAGLGCPWAHRTLVVRVLKGLEDTLPVVTVLPSPSQGIWIFEKKFEGCQTLPELYELSKLGYAGRCTVPVLWDSKTKTIVNNESAEIIVILNSALNEYASHSTVDLYPDSLKASIDQWNDIIYRTVNNGVYRCGFAQTQPAYDRACQELFTTLDEIDRALATRRYLCGDRVTLADVRLFTTLFRFDIVYYGLFKCNRRRIQDYGNLWPYLRDLYQLSDIASTCNLEAIKRDYYGNLFPLNPGGIIPAGPDINLLAPHAREALEILDSVA
jgi:glutathionyl-hydroquinone reductase